MQTIAIIKMEISPENPKRQINIALKTLLNKCHGTNGFSAVTSVESRLWRALNVVIIGKKVLHQLVFIIIAIGYLNRSEIYFICIMKLTAKSKPQPNDIVSW